MAAFGMTPEAVWTGLRRDWRRAWDPEELETWERRGEAWFELVATRREQLEAYALNAGSAAGLVVLIADAEPMDFLAGFWAGVLAGWTVALANANWATKEWQSTFDLINPTITWGSAPVFPYLSPSPNPPSFPALLIPTGGTSGQLKFVCHTWATLTAAVYGFQRYFQPDENTPTSTCCVLPFYHVSGLMQAMRTWLTGGQITIISSKDLLSAPPRSVCLPPYTYLSLVPTQLSRLLTAGNFSLLRQFHAVLLGGAPPWQALLNQAATHQISLCLTYGMTETAAMVSALRSQDSTPDMIGDPLSSGWPMPHATIQIKDGSEPVPNGKIGQVAVTSSAIAYGYYNMPSSSFKGRTLYTDDLGYLDSNGQLHITGRASRKIISGGENVFPSEVESALRSTGQVLDVCVVGLPDTDWGEVVSAAYVPLHSDVSIDSLKVALDRNDQISRYKYPKRWFALESIPKNAQGKINHLLLRRQLDSLASQSVEGQ